MHAISLDFDISNKESVENLYAILGYIRGKEFVIDLVPKKIDALIWEYIQELKVANDLSKEPNLDVSTIILINQLWIDAKYQDPVYIVILHTWLVQLGYTILKKEIETSIIGESTKVAITAAQKSNDFKASGQMTLETEGYFEAAYNGSINTKNNSVEEVKNMRLISTKFNIQNTASVHNLYAVLGYVRGETFVIEKHIKGQIVKEVWNYINELQELNKLEVILELTTNTIALINNLFVDKKYLDPICIRQLHVWLKKANYPVNPEEVDERIIGPSTEEQIKVVQLKYQLVVTGKMSPATEHRLESVYAAIVGRQKSMQPKAILKVSEAAKLRLVEAPLRLSMKGEKIQNLQIALAWLGYRVNKEEYKKETFGKSTLDAVVAFQRANKLAAFGAVEQDMAFLLNKQLAVSNPTILNTNKYRVRGAVRDDLWEGQKGAKVQVLEKQLRGEPILIGEQKSFKNGFYDLIYSPPIDKRTNKPKEIFHLIVRLLDPKGQEQKSITFFNAKETIWANFTDGDFKYKGVSIFEEQVAQVQAVLGDVKIEDLEQNETNQDVTCIYVEKGISGHDVMKLSLAFRVAHSMKIPDLISPELIYGFLYQNMPAALPTYLLPDEPKEWDTWIAFLVESIAEGIVFMDKLSQISILSSATAANIIPIQAVLQLTKSVEQLQVLRHQYALEKPVLNEKGSLVDILKIAKTDRNFYTQISQVFAETLAITPEFLEKLAEIEKLSATDIQAIEDSSKLGQLTQHHLPMMELLQSNITSKVSDTKTVPILSVRDYGKWSEQQWLEFVLGAKVEIPSEIVGDKELERQTLYANQLKSETESLFPSITFIAELSRSDQHQLTKLEAINAFADSNTNFNLKNNNIHAYLSENRLLLDEETVSEIQAIQRIHKLAPTAVVGTTLMNAGIHSGTHLYTLGQSHISSLLTQQGLDPTLGTVTYNLASSQYASALALVSQYNTTFNQSTPQSIINLTTIGTSTVTNHGNNPDLATLFGSLDYCTCQHCRSVYSPAAYLADILRFLGEKFAIGTTSGDPKVREVLFDRRPDIGNIDLNCNNAHTPMPYIDLVCEVLENALVAPASNANFTHNTTLSAEELKAKPEYVRAEAYEHLTELPTVKYPLNLWQEETQLFLIHLGIPYPELMETYQNGANLPNDKEIAAAYFGISSQELPLILNSLVQFFPISGPTLEEIWKFSIDDPMAVTGNSVAVLTFLKVTELSYEELLELLQLSFINTSATVQIDRPVESCALELQTVSNLTEIDLDRIHRFVRLWHHTNWDLWELNLLVENPLIGNNLLDINCLVQLQKFEQLQNKWHLKADELASFYGLMDTQERRNSNNDIILPLYHRVFLNPAIDNPVIGYFQYPAVTTNAIINKTFSSIVSALLAADEEVVSGLLPTTVGTTNIITLSSVYREITLAQKLGISSTVLEQIKTLTGITNVFASLDDTLLLLEYKTAIDHSNMSVDTVDYLLTNEPSDLELSTDTIKEFLEQQRQSLLELKDDLFATNEPPRNLLARHLSKLDAFQEADILNQVLDLITEGKWLDKDDWGTSTAWTTSIEADFLSFVSTHFAIFEEVPIAEIQDKLLPFNITQITATTVAEKQAYIIDRLHYYLAKNIVIQSVATNLGLEEDVANWLLGQYFTTSNTGNNTETLLYFLRKNNLIRPVTPITTIPTYQEVTEVFFPEQFESYRLLHKMMLVVKAWNFSLEEWKTYDQFASRPSFPLLIFKLMELPVPLYDNAGIALHTPSRLAFSKWYNFQQFLTIGEEYATTDVNSLIDVLGQVITGKVDLLDSLANWTGWDRQYLTDIDTHLGFLMLDYTLPSTYQKLQKCFHQLSILRVQPNLVFGWVDRKDDLVQNKKIAEEVKNAAKSKYTPSEWLQKLGPIQDVLRLKKRNALVSFLLHHNTHEWEDTNDLFNYYLIDVEMSPCQVTSRLKQAISSTQLFVQRCLMNLEVDDVTVVKDNGPTDNWSQWEWMQNYRIWEANRKVFLYPENWIEPALRDDKSPFFKELEDELLQAEITHENVEQVFLNYLQKVEEVAHLEVVGMCHGNGQNGEELVHILGKTKEMPDIYYFRTYNKTYKSWTAWEKVDADIKGEHAIPYVYNGKVHIFWLEIMEKPMANKKSPAFSDSGDSRDTPNLYNYKEIQLGWTVKKSNGWSAKKISTRKLIHPWPRPHFSLHLRPRYKSIEKTLWLDIYISTSKEFNKTKYYNSSKNVNEELAGANYDETSPPWHSSSFVFDGFVQKVKLLAISGDYSIYNTIKVTNTTTPTQVVVVPLKIYDIVENFKYFLKVTTNKGDFYLNGSPNLGDMNAAIAANTPSGVTAIRITNIEHYAFSTNYKIFVDPNDGSPGLIYDKKPGIQGWPTLDKLNNYIGTNNNGQSYSSPPPPAPTTSVSTFLQAEEEVNDSFTYVYNNFGKDGRSIEQLDPQLERANSMTLPIGMHYEFNYLTNNLVNTPNNRLLNLPMGASSNVQLLTNAVGPSFRLIVPMEEAIENPSRANELIYQDDYRAFFVRYQDNNKHVFYPFYHPYAKAFISKLTSEGLDALLSRSTQVSPSNSFYFNSYNPTSGVAVADTTTSSEIVDFELDGAYAIYNWELFFHAPLLIATQLSKNQRFEEAIRWFHYIFNPTNTGRDGDTPQRYWVTKPFFEHQDTDYQEQLIGNILANINSHETELDAWKNNPFKPHLIARYRPVAYQKAVVMKYIDNLIDWGDQLFRRETLEAINQATLRYIMAHELLGRRPVEGTGLSLADKSFNELGALDDFANTNVQIVAEGLIGSSSLIVTGSNLIPYWSKYFCLPPNQKLLGYWDLVEDRLFKIRHCMNLTGNVRQLPLFAPPIDPALLVNAVAAGVDLNSVLDDMAVPHSNYKFRVLVRTAAQFCSEVKYLGGKLLAMLQAKDSEGMALLQSSNALKILDAIEQLKGLQVEESQLSIESLEIAKKSVQIRKQFYESKEFMNKEEEAAKALGITSIVTHTVGTVLNTIGGVVKPIPEITTGTIAIIPKAEVKFGGDKLAGALTIAGNVAIQLANIMDKSGNLIAQTGSYKRRQEEWDLQAELATKEIEQIDKQIAAAQIRLAITEKDLENHKLQIENSKSEEEYLKTKYTNQELYTWITSQISTIYFQSYQLAFDMAKRAEKSFRYELGLPSSSTAYIKFGYWDSLKKGLLSGDKLMFDINKMEGAYLEQNKREFELTKHISLARLSPSSLMELKQNGSCLLEIPEWWFDMDYPGHYMRRIKSVSISIPSIVGPYTNVNCTMTMQSNKVRTSNDSSGAYEEDNSGAGFDDRFAYEYGSIQSIATSHGQNDSGVFELNFGGERFLPFEGAGAIGRWKLALADIAQFDYASISDVVIHMKFMARDGGQQLKDKALSVVKTLLNASPEPSALLLSLKQSFPTAWHRFLHPDLATDPHELTFALEDKHYPFYTKGKTKVIKSGVFAIVKKESSSTLGQKYDAEIIRASASTATNTYVQIDGLESTDLWNSATDLSVTNWEALDSWTIKVGDDLSTTSTTTEITNPDDIEDIILVLEYAVNLI
jgi:peptidoglycan hydrolase-like protein with peptidoglycan-binding domain